MSHPNVLILRAPGTNCDAETAFAFERAGAKTETLHINRLLENPPLFQRFQILCVPGGFSYGDDLGAGRILGNQIQHHLADELARFKADGKLMLGICNGFQVLMKSPALLDGDPVKGPAATLTLNDCGRYQDRWVRTEVHGSKSVFLAGIERMYLPMAHAEGKFVARDAETLTAIGLRRPTRAAVRCRGQPERGTNARGGRLRRHRPRLGSDAASRASHRPHAAPPLDPRRSRPGRRRAASVRQRGEVLRLDDLGERDSTDLRKAPRFSSRGKTRALWESNSPHLKGEKRCVSRLLRRCWLLAQPCIVLADDAPPPALRATPIQIISSNVFNLRQKPPTWQAPCR